jgi:hypothetical protein
MYGGSGPSKPPVQAGAPDVTRVVGADYSVVPCCRCSHEARTRSVGSLLARMRNTSDCWRHFEPIVVVTCHGLRQRVEAFECDFWHRSGEGGLWVTDFRDLASPHQTRRTTIRGAAALRDDRSCGAAAGAGRGAADDERRGQKDIAAGQVGSGDPIEHRANGRRTDRRGGQGNDGRATGGCCDVNQKPRAHDTSRKSLGETPGPGGGGVSARVPELRRRHPADCVHHPAGTGPEDSHTPRRTTRACTGVARSGPAHRLGRTCPGA